MKAVLLLPVSRCTASTLRPAPTSIGLIPTEGRATYVSVDPSGKFAYVANGGENSDGSPGVNVLMYTINAATGALNVHRNSSCGFASYLDRLPSVRQVRLCGQCRLEQRFLGHHRHHDRDLNICRAGSSLALDPRSKFAYVVNSGSNDVSTYTVDGTTGALTSLGTTGTGLSPASIALHPSGKFVYVTNGSNSVWMYNIDASTGTLTLIGTIGT